MSPVRVTFKRTCGMIVKSFVTVLSISLFLSGAAALFAFNLDASEGSFASLASVWTSSVSPLLPALAALLGMEVWSDERKTGRMELILSSPVRERDFVFGKFLGVWLLTVASIVVFLQLSLFFLNSYAPRLATEASLVNFLPGLFLLVLQSALWSAVAVAASAMFRSAAGAAAMTIFVLVALPRAMWLALSYWTDNGKVRFAELPMDAHAFDFASGLVSVGVVSCYVLLTVLALFLATKTILSYRFTGRTSRLLRLSTDVSLGLAGLFAILFVSLIHRVDVKLDIPVAGSGETVFSAHTRSILEQARGSITITAFLGREDARFRHVSHFLRSLKRDADEIGGVNLEIRYVDPVLDVGEATSLIRRCPWPLKDACFIFESDGRIVDRLDIDEGYSERIFAAMIARVAVPLHRSRIYWTSAHGEADFEDYSNAGMSDLARELALNGYENKKINLAEETIGKDCALLIIAGPKKGFSEREIEYLQAYLNGHGENPDGGRVLVLMDTAEHQGLANLLSTWGIRAESTVLDGVPTMSGSDVIVKNFSESHPVVRPLEGQQIILQNPLAMSMSSSAIEGGSGADRKRYRALFSAGGRDLAACVERGSLRSDAATRPSRLIAVGDVDFLMNGCLRSYRNANMDFFLNSVNYLSGRDVMVSSGPELDRLHTEMDRDARVSFVMMTSAVAPALVFAIYSLLVLWRRRRR